MIVTVPLSFWTICVGVEELCGPDVTAVIVPGPERETSIDQTTGSSGATVTFSSANKR